MATHTIVSREAAIKVPQGLPLASACLIGCAVSTGVGAVLNTAGVWPGARVAVIGCGAVGLSIIQGARLIHAEQIIGVDLVDSKLVMASHLGATHTVNAHDDAIGAIRDLTSEGVDFAFDAVGTADCIEAAILMTCYGGTAVHIGMPPPDAQLRLDLRRFSDNRTKLVVSHGGDCLPALDFPMLTTLCSKGEIDLDSMVTRRIGLEEIEEAFSAMERGEVVRSVVVFP